MWKPLVTYIAVHVAVDGVMFTNPVIESIDKIIHGAGARAIEADCCQVSMNKPLTEPCLTNNPEH